MKETAMRALLLCMAVLTTTACVEDIQLKGLVSYHLGRAAIEDEESHCAAQSGLRHIELKLGPNPHYLVHCNEGVAAYREIVCNSCISSSPDNSYHLTAGMIKKARTFCGYPKGLEWIHFQLYPNLFKSNPSFTAVCNNSMTRPL